MGRFRRGSGFLGFLLGWSPSFLPEGWKPLVDSLSAVFACLGWATGGFAVGASAASFVIAVSWLLKMAGGNWTRIGR